MSDYDESLNRIKQLEKEKENYRLMVIKAVNDNPLKNHMMNYLKKIKFLLMLL